MTIQTKALSSLTASLIILASSTGVLWAEERVNPKPASTGPEYTAQQFEKAGAPGFIQPGAAEEINRSAIGEASAPGALPGAPAIVKTGSGTLQDPTVEVETTISADGRSKTVTTTTTWDDSSNNTVRSQGKRVETHIFGRSNPSGPWQEKMSAGSFTLTEDGLNKGVSGKDVYHRVVKEEYSGGALRSRETETHEERFDYAGRRIRFVDTKETASFSGNSYSLKLTGSIQNATYSSDTTETRPLTYSGVVYNGDGSSVLTDGSLEITKFASGATEKEVQVDNVHAVDKNQRLVREELTTKTTKWFDTPGHSKQEENITKQRNDPNKRITFRKENTWGVGGEVLHKLASYYEADSSGNRITGWYGYYDLYSSGLTMSFGGVVPGSAGAPAANRESIIRSWVDSVTF